MQNFAEAGQFASVVQSTHPSVTSHCLVAPHWLVPFVPQSAPAPEGPPAPLSPELPHAATVMAATKAPARKRRIIIPPRKVKAESQQILYLESQSSRHFLLFSEDEDDECLLLTAKSNSSTYPPGARCRFDGHNRRRAGSIGVGRPALAPRGGRSRNDAGRSSRNIEVPHMAPAVAAGGRLSLDVVHLRRESMVRTRNLSPAVQSSTSQIKSNHTVPLPRAMP
jgi:hypothetical protein